MKYFKPFIIYFALIILFASQSSYSHPHCWIDTETTILNEDGFFQGVQNNWRFDEYFSMDVIDMIDLNKNGKIEENEKEYAYNNTFIQLKEFGYYNHINLNGKKITDYKIKDFDAKIENNIIVYDFKLVLNNPIEILKDNRITVSIYDDTYFIDIKLGNKESIKYTSKADLIDYQLIEDKDNAIWYGTIFPKTILIQANH
jgi:ABC-type uncharacterized transport system substrate-binding protein